MSQETFKKAARALFIGIFVDMLLAGFNIRFTNKDKSYSENWRFALTHPSIVLHIILATAILITSLIVLLRSIQSQKKSWIIWSLIGLLCILIAYGYGEAYVKNLSSSELSDMGSAGGAAFVVYGVMWYQNRNKKNKKEPPEAKSETPA